MDVPVNFLILFYQNDFDEIDMSGEAGCFFRDQKRRIGEYNYILMFSEESKLLPKIFLIKLTKVKTEFLPLLFSFFFWGGGAPGLPAFQPCNDKLKCLSRIR